MATAQKQTAVGVIALAIIRCSDEPGTVRLTANAAGLPAAEVSFKVQ